MSKTSKAATATATSISARVIHGHCIDVMMMLSEDSEHKEDTARGEPFNPKHKMYAQGCGGRRPSLIFADPPFNIGQGYGDDGDSHDDKMSREDYLAFTRNWLRAANRLLAPAGTLIIHGNDSVAKIVMQNDDVIDEFHQVDWIVWHFRFGQAKKPATATKLINSKAHALVYAKPGESTFNAPLCDSDRATKYGDKRTQDASIPGMRVALDVWGVPSDGEYWGRVQGNNEERIGNHPNQLPERYLQRIIGAYSNPGDLVLDPFGGTGTTGVVAQAMGRDCILIEKSAAYVKDIEARLRRGAVRPILERFVTPEIPVA